MLQEHLTKQKMRFKMCTVEFLLAPVLSGYRILEDNKLPSKLAIIHYCLSLKTTTKHCSHINAREQWFQVYTIPL